MTQTTNATTNPAMPATIFKANTKPVPKVANTPIMEVFPFHRESRAYFKQKTGYQQMALATSSTTFLSNGSGKILSTVGPGTQAAKFSAA